MTTAAETETRNRILHQWVLRNPEGNYAQFQEFWEKTYPERKDIPIPQRLYNVRRDVRLKFGVKSLSDIKRTLTGEVQVHTLAGLLFRKAPALSYAEMSKLLESEGFQLSRDEYERIRPQTISPAVVPSKKEAAAEPNEEPKGPRARYVGKKNGRRKHRRTSELALTGKVERVPRNLDVKSALAYLDLAESLENTESKAEVVAELTLDRAILGKLRNLRREVMLQVRQALKKQGVQD